MCSTHQAAVRTFQTAGSGGSSRCLALVISGAKLNTPGLVIHSGGEEAGSPPTEVKLAPFNKLPKRGGEKVRY